MQLKQGTAPSGLNYQSLQDSIGVAISKSRKLGRSVLLSYCKSWQCIDPLLFLAAKSKPGQHKFYWQQAEPDLILAAAGMVATLSHVENPFTRFASAKQFARQYLTDAAICGETNGNNDLPISPYILGGFSFYDRSDRTTPAIWSGFPEVMLFVPRWLMQRTGKFCSVTINHCVQPQDELESVECAIADVLEHLRARYVEDTSLTANAPHLAAPILCKEIVSDLPWTETVKQAVHLIKQGKLDKVVLARTLDVITQQAFNPIKVLHSLRCRYPECISFLVDGGLSTTFLGATPELLLRFQPHGANLRLRSNAVAGSIGRSRSLPEDRLMGDRLLHSQKDLGEHKIVVKSIRDRLQMMGATLDRCEPPKLLKLSNVQHLYTPITAELPNCHWLDAFDVLAQLHPTAAVGGEPRDAALTLMQKWESCDRGWYAAPVGWMNGNGEGTFAVGIRSGYLHENKARIYAGAGIVADSQFDAELGETSIKFAALLQALGIPAMSKSIDNI